MTLFADLVAVSETLRQTAGRRDKIATLAAFLSSVSVEEIRLAVSYLSGELPQGRTGIGVAALQRSMPAVAGEAAPLTLQDVDEAFDAIQAITGAGSQSARQERLGALLAAATGPEIEFVWRLVLGDLRQGALEGLMVDAVAAACDVPVRQVRRAHMLGGDLAEVAAAARTDGEAALEAFRLEVFRPVLPMLAQSAPGVEEALTRYGEAAVEWKIDGARIQVHKEAETVRIYSRTRHDVTERLPEIAADVATFPAETLILDGEAIAIDDAGRPRRFQETMGRFATTSASADDGEAMRLSGFFFDCLHRDGIDLLEQTAADRARALEDAVPEQWGIPRLVTDSEEEAAAFFAAALAAGHEGIMVKSLQAPYEAGRRGSGWLKVKPVRTLDLVVLAVEWGSGRRRGLLSNIHLGARDPETDGFVMLGKTFKGMTDEMLRWQTERFLELETHREGHVVHVKPEQVVEIACDGVQASPRYPAGMALRFARVKRYRDDKIAGEADTIDTVRAMFAGETP